jgi:hypothetical protein
MNTLGVDALRLFPITNTLLMAPNITIPKENQDALFSSTPRMAIAFFIHSENSLRFIVQSELKVVPCAN